MFNNYNYLENENLSKHVELGQTVYIVPVGNAMRYNKEGTSFDYVKKRKVSKVGRKYFYVDNANRMKYGYQCYAIVDISNYSADYEVYLNKKDFDEAMESEKLKYIGSRIKDLFERMTLEDKKILAELVEKYS